MPQTFTAERLQLLQSAVNAGNRDAYYKLLVSWGYTYGNLALQVVHDNSLSGAVANSYLRSVAASNGVFLSNSDLKNIGIDLMRADWALRQSLVGSNSDLQWNNYRDYHSDVLRSYGLPPEAWTAYTPLTLAPASDRAEIWSSMVAASSFLPQLANGVSLFVETADHNPLFASYTSRSGWLCGQNATRPRRLSLTVA